MSNYEAVYLLKTNLADEARENIIAKFEKIIGVSGGTLVKTEKLGRRRLTTLFDKNREAFYVISEFVGNGGCVKELERNFKVAEEVLRFMVVRVKEKENSDGKSQ
jgi:small subunit ribosomal protein S6